MILLTKFWTRDGLQISLLMLTKFKDFLMITVGAEVTLLKFSQPFKRQPHKMVKHTQTIRWH